MMNVNSNVHFKFEDLMIYQKAIDFIKFSYKTTKDFPKEQYSLISQFQRAAQSIGLNIAEGSGGTNAQFIRFLRISQGSIFECVVCTTIARNEGYITEENSKLLRMYLAELSKMTSGLINSLSKRKDVTTINDDQVIYLTKN